LRLLSGRYVQADCTFGLVRCDPAGFVFELQAKPSRLIGSFKVDRYFVDSHVFAPNSPTPKLLLAGPFDPDLVAPAYIV
jgi:hypothetical protein